VAGCPHALEEQELYLSIALFERTNALPFAGRNLQASAAKPPIVSFPRTLELCQPRHFFFGYQPPFNIPLLEVNISILEPERWTIVCISSPCSDYLFARISRFRGKDRRDLEADGNRDRSIWSLSTHRIQNKTATDSGYEEVDSRA